MKSKIPYALRGPFDRAQLAPEIGWLTVLRPPLPAMLSIADPLAAVATALGLRPGEPLVGAVGAERQRKTYTAPARRAPVSDWSPPIPIAPLGS
jgi:hypothetical protein